MECSDKSFPPLRIIMNLQKKYFISFLAICFYISGSLSAKTSNWYCTEVASEKDGNTIRACGVGSGKDENEARTSAFNNAKNEFSNICSESADCKNRKITVSPQRTACEPYEAGYKCYRLIEFTILTEVDVKKIDNSIEVYKSSSMPSQIDENEKFAPFVYAQSEKYPKVKKGMSKKEVLALFGAPSSVTELSSDRLMIFFDCKTTKFCTYTHTNASIVFDKKGVESFENIHFNYTEQLK